VTGGGGRVILILMIMIDCRIKLKGPAAGEADAVQQPGLRRRDLKNSRILGKKELARP